MGNSGGRCQVVGKLRPAPPTFLGRRYLNRVTVLHQPTTTTAAMTKRAPARRQRQRAVEITHGKVVRSFELLMPPLFHFIVIAPLSYRTSAAQGYVAWCSINHAHPNENRCCLLCAQKMPRKPANRCWWWSLSSHRLGKLRSPFWAAGRLYCVEHANERK